MCILFGEKEDIIQKVLGICQEHYEWKDYFYFLEHRKSYVRLPFRPTSKDQVFLSTMPTGFPRCDFPDTCHECRTVFLDKELTNGVWQWTVQISYKTPFSKFWFGFAPSDCLESCEDLSLGLFAELGSASLHFKSCKGRLLWRLAGVETADRLHEDESPLMDNSLVTIEADIDAQTVCFFVENEKAEKEKLAFGISRILTPIYFGMSGMNASFSSVFFRRLCTPTPSPVPCKYFQSAWDETIRNGFLYPGREIPSADLCKRRH